MALYLIYMILEASWFRGKTLAIMSSFFNRLFTVLSLTSMFAMMANMYLAVSFGLKYFCWKTNKKTLLCVFLIWFFGTMLVMLSLIPLLEIDLGDARVIEYRADIFEQGKRYFAFFVIFFIICGAVVCFLTVRAIKKKNKAVCMLLISNAILITLLFD